MTLIFGVIFLILFAIVLVAISLGMRFLEAQRRKQVEGVLAAVSGADQTAVETTILRPTEQDASTFEAMLGRANVSSGISRMIQQSGLEWTPAGLVSSMGIAALVGAVLGAVFRPLPLIWLSIPLSAALLASFPVLFLRFKKSSRMKEIESQLPEALDFLARSMRAGHAFTISLEMVGQELPAPLGQEFRTLFNELNLGSPIETAMGNFAERVPLLDVRLLVSSILLQRQTGGNLSEILVRLAYVIRERFRLRGQVRAASAHGRITALVLTAMPFVMLVLLPQVAPGYLQGMIDDPDGKWMLAGAGVAQLLGYFTMRSITNIKV